MKTGRTLRPLKEGSGAKPKIDFAVVQVKENEKQEPEEFVQLALETKWVSDSSDIATSIARDIIRLRLIREKYNCSAYLILAGKKKKFDELVKDVKGEINMSTMLSFELKEEPKTFEVEDLYGLLNSSTRKKLFSSFQRCEIHSRIRTKMFGKNLSISRDSQYVVYGWRIQNDLKKKFNLTTEVSD